VDVDRFLPLAPAMLQILLALADEDRHGYAIMQDVSQRTQGKVRLSPGTLYGNIKRMVEQDLIEELDERPVVGDDERRRYYRITRLGRQVATAEVTRMSELVAQARLLGLQPGPAGGA